MSTHLTPPSAPPPPIICVVCGRPLTSDDAAFAPSCRRQQCIQAHRKRTAPRAFQRLAGSPLAQMTPTEKWKPGRPSKSPYGAMSPAERKRLSRAKRAREEEIERLKREQKVDKETGGKGGGMFMKDSPEGKGRISVYRPVKIALMSDLARAEEDKEGEDKKVRPHGHNAGWDNRGWDNSQEPGTNDVSEPSIDPACFGKAASDQEKARRKEVENVHLAESLIKSEHRCRLCDFASGENRDVFVHIQNEHSNKTLSELQITSTHQCTVCEAKFSWRRDAVEHILNLQNNSPDDTPEVRRSKVTHRKAFKGK